MDLDRVVAVGHSAGGHLALWAAGRRDARVPLRGAVGQAAVSDLASGAEQGLGRGIVARFCGGTPAGRPEAYALASPAQRLPTGVAQLLVHGGQDGTVPVGMSEAYAVAARAARDAVELAVHPDAGHMEHVEPGSAMWADVVGWIGDLAGGPSR